MTCWRGRDVRFAPLDVDDAQLIHRWRSDPVALREAGFWPRALSTVRERVENDVADGGRDDFLVLLEDGTPIGHIALTGQDLVVGTDAVDALVDFAFGEMLLYRLEAVTHTTNAAALAVLAKSGFVEEGVRCATCPHRGSRHDLAVLSLLRPEWEALTRPRAWDH
ncbi:GNAT family N-acetyltransferase [Streptomyces sp. 2MCAF27]